VLWCLPPMLAAGEVNRTLEKDIPAQSLEAALRDLLGQTGKVDWGPDVAGRMSRKAYAGQTLPKALCAMLKDTGLTFDSSFTIYLSPVPSASCNQVAPVLEEIRVSGSNKPFACLSVDLLSNCPAGVDLFSSASTRGPEARELDGDSSIDQMSRLLPGLDFTQLSSVGGNIYTLLAINGVIDRHGNTTGIWWDHVPLPAATSNSFARTIPYNFDVEVTTRFGPQPVLFGANAQSGAIEYMPLQPKLDLYEGQVRSEWAVTEGGAPTRELGAAWGGPIIDDKLAFRVGGWYRTEGGYVDRVNPFVVDHPVVEANSNRMTMESARVALLYKPSESVTLSPSYVYQSTIGRDSPSFMLWEDPDKGALSDPSAGRFLNGSIIRQPISDSFRIASLGSRVNFGSVNLEGVTGYVRRRGAMTSDDATSKRWHCLDLATPQCEYPAGPDDLVTTSVNLAQRSFSQQLQLTHEGGSTTWLLGGFFSNLHSYEIDRVFAEPIPSTIQAYYNYLASVGQAVPDEFFWRVPTTIDQRQLAGFAQLSQKFMDKRLTVGAGLRVEHQRVRAEAVAPVDGSIPEHAIDIMQLRDPLPEHSNTVFAPQIGLTYAPHPTDEGRDQSFYVYYATGYAPGNVDAARPTCREPPTVYPSDKLQSIQAGMQQAWSNARTRLKIELFQMDWDNGPQAWRTCLFMHLPGKARSRGFRFSAEAAPFHGAFTATLEAAYVDARYRETIRNDYLGRLTDTGGMPAPDDSILVRKGDALGTPPQVIAPWSIKATLQKRFNLTAGTTLALRLIDTFHSRNPGPFYTEDPQAKYPGNLQADPANNLLDARAIVTRGDVNVVFYVSNVLDSRPVLSRRNKGNDESTIFYATTFRPRTYGLSVNWNIKGEAAGN